MKKLILSVFLLASVQIFSQIKYEAGYIVTNDGQKQNVLILNKDWRNNPTQISYKISETEKAEIANLNSIQEFGVGDFLKYHRFTVPVDRSGTQVRDLSSNIEPEFSTETVFLRQLLSGEVNLYLYKEGALERYYLSTADTEVTPLIYKEFRRENRISSNNKFREQLYNFASCPDTTPADLQKISYNRKELISYLESYYRCQNLSYDLIEEENKKMQLNFGLKAGVDFANLEVKKGIYVQGTTIDLDPSLRIGAEIEAVMPFNRNKWALFVEPFYTSQNIEKMHIISESQFNNHEVDLSVDYKFISVATGLRHYMFITNSSKLYLSAAVSFDVKLKTSVLIDRDDRYELDPMLEDTRTDAYLNLGFGYSYGRASAELRYNSARRVSGSNLVERHYVLDWESEVSSFSLVLGYKIF